MLFDNTQFYSPVLDTLEHGTEHVALEISFPGRDRTIELSVTTSRIHNTHGEMIGALVIFSDLTARKETQRRMAQAERLATLGELMAGVAHEVRNPLTAIRGYVQILRQQTSDLIHQEYLSVVLKEIDSINKVIQQLLEFSRPRHSQWQQVSLNALVEETLVLVQTAGVQARVDFISELDNELNPINADRELLKQVLLNILINAVQAISARGKIRIQTWQYSDSQQAISIEDNGCGIDLSLQKKIFDPFFTTKASGTGLGLALSQRIINAHQGDIRVASLPGYGATFTLILPINPQGKSDCMTAINRILIVDDEDNVRRMLSTAFALQGFETHCANNGRTALHLFADIHPDVVLMDIRMPEMDGIKALKEMRSHETRTPVILMTAYAEVETAVEALRCGAFDYVIKPFDLDELNLIVQRALQLQSMKKRSAICTRH